jgi:NAD(P)-dependent dehydrogenase (short-subunit alcohol dehydrogenase family)
VTDKVCVVTGGGSGIGRATATLLAAEGAIVIVSDIDAEGAERVAGAIRDAGGKADAARLDVADETAWKTVIATTLARRERVDVLVNNAGIALSKPIMEMTLDQWRRVLAVNLEGVFLGTKYAIDAMSSRGGGSIINIASVAGIHAYPGSSAYGASKAAVRHLSRIAAIECADAQNGVRVNVVAPGGVKTPIWESVELFKELVAKRGGTEEAFAALGGKTASEQFSAPEEIAQTILFLASDESSHLTGVELVIAQGHAG